MSGFEIRGATAFVTGANKRRGIGQAVVRALLDGGAKKIYATARDTAQLRDLIREAEGRVVAVSLDVTDPKAVAELGDRHPDVNLLVNNAGVATLQGALDDVAAAEQEIAVNYIAPLRLIKSFAGPLKRHAQGGGAAVVNLNSIASFVNFPILGTYSASKAAAHSLTQAQRRDLAGVLVVGVYPGPIDTDMTEEVLMDKVPPTVVARAIVDALREGIEDVFPDPTSQQLFATWKADPKGIERDMAQQATT